MAVVDAVLSRPWLSLVGWLAVVNLWAVAAFALDKAAARGGRRRIPEATLLLIVLLGGWPGAQWARRRFRHKTFKQPFGRSMLANGLMSVLLLAGAATWALGLWSPLEWLGT